MRLHVFEFNDLPWYPAVWRRILTACTGMFAVVYGVYEPIVSKLSEALRTCESDSILDLCSGSASPLPSLACRITTRQGLPVTVTLSDKYPDVAALECAARRWGDGLDFIATPVDAASAPPAGGAFRTVFTGFHHFEPEAAGRILQDAVDHRVGIGVFEYTGRSPAWFARAMAAPFFCWAVAPRAIRPFTWESFLWVYVLPIPVLLVAWDGIVSGLRTYDPQELRQLIDLVDAPGYAWETGRVRAEIGQVTYLIGCPRAET